MAENFRQMHPGLLDRSMFSDLAIGTVGYYRQAEGHRARRDVVTEYQVAYCIEGKGTIESAGRSAKVSKGWIFINIPGNPHYYYADPRDPWTLWWVHFIGKSASRYLRMMRCTPAEPAFEIGMNDRLVDLFSEMYREVSRPEQDHQLLALAHLHMILSLISSIRRHNVRERSMKGRARAAIDMEKISRYIDKNMETISLQSLANESAMSIPHFERLFKQRTGYSPMQYVNRRRVTMASSMLSSRHDLSVKEIALHVGVEDQHYFSRMFKKITGRSPLQYREMYR